MFCPKCATQNIEGASFCRSCGANISLIPHALTGQLPTRPQNDERWSRRKRRRGAPTVDEGIRSVVMGFGFIAVAAALALFGQGIGAHVWWFWLLIPAFGCLGRGIAEIVRANQLKSSQASDQQKLTYVAPPQQLPTTNTAELRPPAPSVTEGTTRHLGTEAPTRTLDSVSSEKRP